VVEDGGRVHGLFTWTLLDGLQGAAVDEYGMVTSRSLADWMRNAVRARMAPDDVNDPDVAKEPDILKEDTGLVFARGLAPKTYKMTFSFPATAEGKDARLWAGRPPRIKQSFVIPASSVDLTLPPGLYVLDAPGAGLRQGVEVTGPGTIAITDAGAPVGGQSGEIFSLDVSPAEPATEIFVLDERFGLIDRNSGNVQLRLPFGIYKVKTRLGRSIKEKVLLLDHDRPILDGIAAVPVMTAAPLPNTTASHEYQQAAAVSSPAVFDVTKGQGAAITVMVRIWTEQGQAPAGLQPWLGVKVVDQSGVVLADLERDGTRDTSLDPYAVCSLSVAPGTYFLRQKLQNGQEMDQSLVVPDDWNLRVFVLRVVAPGGQALSPYPRVSLMTHKLGTPFSLDDPARKNMEFARVALADERAILNDQIEQLLLLKFDDPLAGIIGGHLLLIEQERDPKRDISLLDVVVKNLRSLVGTEHPDVECLSLSCLDPALRRTTTLQTPPIYQRSWKLLIDASRQNQALLPKDLWERVQAYSTLPPYLIWASDTDSKAAARKAVVEALITMANSALAMPAPAEIPGLVSAFAKLVNAGLTIVGKSGTSSLSSKVLAAAVENAASRLQLPSSAIQGLGKDVISKLKG
jgi:hypothetical protein